MRAIDVSANRTPLSCAGPLIEPEVDAAVDARVIDVVGDLAEHRVGVDVEADLRAVPAGVGEPVPLGHPVRVPARAFVGSPA